jgi:hypothetical protein
MELQFNYNDIYVATWGKPDKVVELKVKTNPDFSQQALTCIFSFDTPRNSVTHMFI